jgi:hypothetical protein
MAEAHPTEDEYNWDDYTRQYSHQVKEMEAAPHQGSDFLVTNFERKDGKLVFGDNLHGNWMSVYSQIDELKPQSVFECGCGGMYHLKNIRTLFPDVAVGACDLLQSQISFGAEKFEIGEDLLKNVAVRDMSIPGAVEDLEQHEFVYSHAVIMHVSQEKAVEFVRNMLEMSSKYVYMVEGDQHDYIDLVATVGDGKWDVSCTRRNSFLFAKNN